MKFGENVKGQSGIHYKTIFLWHCMPVIHARKNQRASPEPLAHNGRTVLGKGRTAELQFPPESIWHSLLHRKTAAHSKLGEAHGKAGSSQDSCTES